MFKIILLRPILANFIRPFSISSMQKPVATTFGDPRMPDKLYKMIELEMKGAEPAVLKSYQTFITSVAEHLSIDMGKTWSLDKPLRQRWDLLKSVHIYRKHIVQYEVRTHYTWIQLHKLTGSTADTFLEYIERMLPEGVALKVTKVSLEPMPEHLAEEIEMKVREQKGDVEEVSGEPLGRLESEEALEPELETEETQEENVKELSSSKNVELKQPELETEETQNEVNMKSQNVLNAEAKKLKSEQLTEENVSDDVQKNDR